MEKGYKVKVNIKDGIEAYSEQVYIKTVDENYITDREFDKALDEGIDIVVALI